MFCTKGSSFVHPLNGKTAIDFINAFDETFNTFYQEDEVPVSNQYYWFYNGNFKVFSNTKKKVKSIKRPKN